MLSKNIAIYTAISNGYDSLKVPNIPRAGVRFVAFSNFIESSRFWELRRLCDAHDASRNCRIHKILSHKYIKGVEYSIWMDGSMQVFRPLIPAEFIEEHLAEHDLAIFAHPLRNCIYQEAEACIEEKVDYEDVIRKQIAGYRAEGYPENNGLVESRIILRRHTEEVRKFNEAWWQEVKNKSRRDQLSFNYVAHKLNFKYKTIPGSLLDHPVFKFCRHKGERKIST